MGLGRFKNGKFDLVVVANFSMTDDDWVKWERALKKASEIFFNASEGQMQFGRIFVCDDSAGLDTAELILHPSGDPSYGSPGGFGTPGTALHLMPYVTTRGPLTIVHEMGHHVWALGDEYTGPYIYDEIDRANPAPDNRTIPIIDTGRDDDELVGRDATLGFNDTVERIPVIANTATTVTVESDFSDLPTNSEDDYVWYESEAECADTTGSNFCIMEKSRTAAGYYTDSGDWIERAYPVTEFCAPSNHDPDGDTLHEDRYGKSCWEVILEREEFANLSMPDPAEAGPTTGWTEPEWIVLEKKPRFALVLDRSASMSQGNKMVDAQHGAIYWMEYCAQGEDLLAINWYNHQIDPILDLTEVGTLADLDDVTASILALSPGGSTNIRDGLYAALDQIQTPPTRAAVQVALVLTDGKHNTPQDSQATEVLPDFQEAGTRIYTLGVGAEDAVDMDMLDQLAAGSGGRSYAVGDNQPGQVETAMVEINAEVRGGIITTAPATFPDSSRDSDDDLPSWPKKDRPAKRTSLKALLGHLKIRSLSAVLHPSKRGRRRFAAISAYVEKGCGRASFSLVHPENQEVWLYLVDPDGTPVNMEDNEVQHVISKSPHEFAIVRKPKPGRWTLIAFRPLSGKSFAVHGVIGGENRHLQVFGEATRSNPVSTPVRIRASARYIHELSSLKATARIVAPDGRHHDILLSDTRFEDRNSGQYEGYFLPETTGRYRGTIRIENSGNATVARPKSLLLHSDQKSISLQTAVPRFIRQIPIYFDSGPRSQIKDEELAHGLPDKFAALRPRVTKLKSAKTLP
jgi:hypothetical protein